MKVSAILIVALMGAGLPFGAPAAGAQERVLATVDGVAITEADLQMAETDIGVRVTGLAGEARRAVLLEYLIGTQLLAAAAKSEGLDSGQKYQERLRYYQRRALVEQFTDKHVASAVRPEDARRAYDAEAGSLQGIQEVRVRHIQLETEAQATLLRSELAKGGDFAKLAQAVSLDAATSWLGGDLGYFAKGEMKPWLESAAFALKPGDVSKPVKSDDGWHLLLLEERRLRPVPAFDAVKDRIRAALAERKVQEAIAGLRKQANVTVVDRR
jgi:peptidyl-prolyl cis-trans isomerase C